MSPATAKARERHNAAVTQRSTAERKLGEEEQALAKVNDPTWFGVDGAWKKLDGTCLSKDTGEYVLHLSLGY